MFAQTKARSLTLAVLFAGLALYGGFGGFYAREIVVEIAILAILAISLDLVAGFGGMVSLGHGALLGLSAYGYGVLTVKFGWSPLPASLVGVTMAGASSALMGWVTSRTQGIYFIMATLAFGQMAYTLVFRSHWLGGDDGMAGLPRFDLGWAGVAMGDSLVFALFALVLVALCYCAAAWVMRSGFGRTLSGIRANEARMQAMGIHTRRHRALAMGLSGLLAGIGGILAAQHIQFISPELLHWTRSGEVLIVVILGGLGTLAGPIIGAVAFILIKHETTTYTDHWHLVIGVVLIVAVLGGGRGLFGQFEHWTGKRSRARRA